MKLQEQITRIHEIMKIKEYNFDNWVVPDLKKLKLEFKIEHEIKGNKFFDSEKQFINSVKNGKIIEITSKQDLILRNRSRTHTFDELLNLIKTYKSYPTHRNEETLKNIYRGFENNQQMELPIIIEFNDGSRKIFSGNTRMDVAFQLGIIPKVLLIKSKN